MRSFVWLFAAVLSLSLFAGDAEKPVSPLPAVTLPAAPVAPVVPAVTTSPIPVQMHIKGNEVFATVNLDITDLVKLKKAGTVPDQQGKQVKFGDEEFKRAVAQRLAQQVTNSYNVMLQTDADLEKRGKEAKERVDKDLEDAKKARPRILIED